MIHTSNIKMNKCYFSSRLDDMFDYHNDFDSDSDSDFDSDSEFNSCYGKKFEDSYDVSSPTSDEDYNVYSTETVIGKINEIMTILQTDPHNDGKIEKLYDIFCKIVIIDEHHKAIDFLLFGKIYEKTIDPAYMNNYAIKQASKYGCIKNVKLLLKHTGIDVSACDGVHVANAVSNGHTEIVKLFLQNGNIFDLFDRYYQKKILLIACKKNYHDIVELLINDDRIFINDYYWELLDIVSINGSIEIVKLFLLSEKSFVDPLNDSATVLSIAAKFGHLKIIKFLLTEYEIKEKDYGELSDGELSDDELNCKIINGKLHPSIDKNDAIIVASKHNKVKIVKYLLEHPAIKTTNFIDIIHRALKHENYDIVKLFVLKIDPNQVTLSKFGLQISGNFLNIVKDIRKNK